jgi:hypothetical protein
MHVIRVAGWNKALVGVDIAVGSFIVYKFRCHIYDTATHSDVSVTVKCT